MRFEVKNALARNVSRKGERAFLFCNLQFSVRSLPRGICLFCHFSSLSLKISAMRRRWRTVIAQSGCST